MSKVQIANDLFLGNIELTRLQQFLSEDGFRKLLKLQTYSYGVIRDKIELGGGSVTSDNFKIVAGTGAGTVKLAIDSYAIDSDFNLIVQKAFDNLAIVAGSWYFLMINYNGLSLEEGYVSVDTQGQMTGDANTKFLTTLRGMPDFPSKIRFTDDINGVNYTAEYEVLSVIDDTNAILQGDFSGGGYSNVRYELIGTFTPGYVVPTGDKAPLKYDSCLLSLIAGDDPTSELLNIAVPPTPRKTPSPIFPAVPEDGKYFYIAAVYNDSGTVEIFDCRPYYKYTTFAEKEAESYVQCDSTTKVFSSFYNFKLGTYVSFDHASGEMTLTRNGNIFIPTLPAQSVLKSISGFYENDIIYLKLLSDDGYVQIADPASGGQFLNLPARYYTALAEGIWTILRKTANVGEWEFIAFDEFISDEILTLTARVAVLETDWASIASTSLLPYVGFDSGFMTKFDSVISCNYHYKIEKNLMFLNFEAILSVEDPGSPTELYIKLPGSYKVVAGKSFKSYFYFKTQRTEPANVVQTTLEATAVANTDHILLKPIIKYSGTSPVVITQGESLAIGITTVPYRNSISGQIFFEFTI